MPCRATAKSAWQRVWTITSASQCERLNFRPRWNAENGRFRIHSIERALSRTVPSVGQNQLRGFRRRLLALSGREKIEGKAKLIVDFDQEVGQPHAAHLLCQPGFEAGQTILFLLV